MPEITQNIMLLSDVTNGMYVLQLQTVAYTSMAHYALLT